MIFWDQQMSFWSAMLMLVAVHTLWFCVGRWRDYQREKRVAAAVSRMVHDLQRWLPAGDWSILYCMDCDSYCARWQLPWSGFWDCMLEFNGMLSRLVEMDRAERDAMILYFRGAVERAGELTGATDGALDRLELALFPPVRREPLESALEGVFGREEEGDEDEQGDGQEVADGESAEE